MRRVRHEVSRRPARSVQESVGGLLGARSFPAQMEEIIMTTKSAPTASVEAFMANEASSNELASKLELANMVSHFPPS